MLKRINYYPLLTLLTLFLLFTACSDNDPVMEDPGERFVDDDVFATIDLSLNIKYGENMDQSGNRVDLLVDIYEPSNDTAEVRPLVIMAHGGNFNSGNKNDMALIANNLARSGYVGATISYRLLEDIDPLLYTEEELLQAVIEAVHDMKAAVRFFTKDAQTTNLYKIDPENIFIGGYSAGAVTALHYGYLNDLTEAGEAGQFLVDYLNQNNGFEGNSGNNGFPSDVKGVINIAGALLEADWLDAGEPILYSIHGTADDVVPFLEGQAGGTVISTEGSGLIHPVADQEGVINDLNAIQGGGHDAILFCISDCLMDIRVFMAGNL